MNLLFPLDPSQAQSIMSFTRGRTRWKNHRPHRRNFALNHIAALRIGICVWITSLLTTGVMAVKNQNSKFIFDIFLLKVYFLGNASTILTLFLLSSF